MPSERSQPPTHNPLAEPSPFDDKGRCTKHPHIRLRKKKMLGGWKILLVNCPDCCIEEMLRMRREGGSAKDSGSEKRGKSSRNRNSGPSGSDSRNGSRRQPSVDGSAGSNAPPPISQLTITHNDDSDNECSSQASEITYGTRTSGSSYSQQHLEDSGSAAPQRATRMPFTDAYGEKGWYTGEVASGSGLPHGQGTMHYCDGRVHSGLWSNGLAAGGPKNTHGNGNGGGAAMMGGGGPAPHRRGTHQTMTSPGGQHASSGASVSSRTSRSSRNNHGGSYSNSLNHMSSRPPPRQQQSPMMPPHRQQQQPPPQQRRQSPPAPASDAVLNLQWTDLNGKDGYYTGETDESGEPHGMGSMRYIDDNTVLEGEWYHGELERQMHQHGIVSMGGSRSDDRRRASGGRMR